LVFEKQKGVEKMEWTVTVERHTQQVMGQPAQCPVTGMVYDAAPSSPKYEPVPDRFNVIISTPYGRLEEHGCTIAEIQDIALRLREAANALDGTGK